MLENMAFNNNDVKSMNSPLIILSRSCTTGSDTGGVWLLNGVQIVGGTGVRIIGGAGGPGGIYGRTSYQRP